MGYISFGEDFQPVGGLGCGGNCGCAPCAARRLGSYGLSEWYEEDDDDEPDTPASPQAAARNRAGSTMGEPPLRLERQPPSLLQRDPTPPWQRRVLGTLNRDLPPLTLRPPFQPTPGAGIPSPLPRLELQPPRLLQRAPTPLWQRRVQGALSRDLPPLTLRPPFQPTPGTPPPPPRLPDLWRPPTIPPDMLERWERERRNRELFGPRRPLPPPPPTLSLGDAIRRYLDTGLDRVLSGLRIPPTLRGPIRNAARDAIGRGVMEGFDRALTGAGIGDQAREAITTSVRAAMEQIRVR